MTSTLEVPDAPQQEVGSGSTKRRSATFNATMVRRALIDSFVKLSPRHMKSNPVMFVVELGSVLTTFYLIRDFGSSSSSENVFALSIVVWLWFTVLFANFAEAVAEGRGKAQADTLRKTRAETVAYVQRGDDIVEVASSQLQLGDLCVVTPGQLIPGDGDIVEGIATVDESAITGESAPVIRESGGDRSSVTGGTRVLSDRIVVKITSKPGETFLDRMIALVEGASRQKTPNEIALDILLAGLTIIFMFTVVSLQPFSIYSGGPQSIIVLVALLVCLIPTTIGALLSAIGIAGMDRLVQRNVLAMSGRAVEAAGDVSTLLLDKTGTITFGNRRADVFVPMPDVEQHELAAAAMLSSLADETPEGRSIVELAESHYGQVAEDVPGAELVPFTAQTRPRRGRPVDPQGCSRLGPPVGHRPGRDDPGGPRPDRGDHLQRGWHAAGGGRRATGARRHPSEGRGQARHRREVHRDAQDGHPHGHDHRGQPTDREGHRCRGRRRRLPRRGHPRGQDGPHQGRAVRGPPGGDDR
jgi:K+-transporting ATPase ATPase B chain